ncbi:hypothetical protein [Rhodoblastus sp.]|uniref:hypothetical protein n=1 Tax=Rhodoblastus sp. TaxID=1962975 RepID=UPI0025CC27FD|nr:hypothetical protein [Rhodoblastus sp.]
MRSTGPILKLTQQDVHEKALNGSALELDAKIIQDQPEDSQIGRRRRTEARGMQQDIQARWRREFRQIEREGAPLRRIMRPNFAYRLFVDRYDKDAALQILARRIISLADQTMRPGRQVDAKTTVATDPAARNIVAENEGWNNFVHAAPAMLLSLAACV